MSRKSKLAFTYAGGIDEHRLLYAGDVRKEINRAFKSGYDAGKGKANIKKTYNKPTTELVDDMKMFHGIPPHDYFNIVQGDGYFSNDLRDRIQRAGCSWDEVLEAKKQGRKELPNWDK